MRFYDRLHALHRIWRYRLRTERQELKYMLGRVLPPGGSVLDIGANRGIYSYWMHKAFAAASQVVAFEPQPELVEYLGDFKKSFHLERMMIAPVGLSSRAGTLSLRRPQQHWGGATFDDQTTFEDRVDTLSVPVMTLDDYFQQHPELRPIRFIKCDVQNHEADVMRGAATILREDQPELLMEWADGDPARRESLFKLLTGLGYHAFRFAGGVLEPAGTAERLCGPMTWENYLFLPDRRILKVA